MEKVAEIHGAEPHALYLHAVAKTLDREGWSGGADQVRNAIRWIEQLEREHLEMQHDIGRQLEQLALAAEDSMGNAEAEDILRQIVKAEDDFRASTGMQSNDALSSAVERARQWTKGGTPDALKYLQWLEDELMEITRLVHNGLYEKLPGGEDEITDAIRLHGIRLLIEADIAAYTRLMSRWQARRYLQKINAE